MLLPLFRTFGNGMIEDFMRNFPEDDPALFLLANEYILNNEARIIRLSQENKTRIPLVRAEQFGFQRQVQEELHREGNVDFDLTGKIAD